MEYLSKENDEILYEYELNKIQIRINESINRCEEFKNKERAFKEKFFSRSKLFNQGYRYILKIISKY